MIIQVAGHTERISNVVLTVQQECEPGSLPSRLKATVQRPNTIEREDKDTLPRQPLQPATWDSRISHIIVGAALLTEATIDRPEVMRNWIVTSAPEYGTELPPNASELVYEKTKAHCDNRQVRTELDVN